MFLEVRSVENRRKLRLQLLCVTTKPSVFRMNPSSVSECDYSPNKDRFQEFYNVTKNVTDFYLNCQFVRLVYDAVEFFFLLYDMVEGVRRFAVCLKQNFSFITQNAYEDNPVLTARSFLTHSRNILKDKVLFTCISKAQMYVITNLVNNYALFYQNRKTRICK